MNYFIIVDYCCSIRHVFCNYGISTDFNMIPYCNSSDNFRSRAYNNIIPYYRRGTGIRYLINANSNLMKDCTIFADGRIARNNDSHIVRNPNAPPIAVP